MALADTIAQIDSYVNYGTPPGSFIQALLENDLVQSFARADNSNIRDMFNIVNYLYNNVPITCRGSKEVISDWIEHKRKERETNER